MPMMVPVVTVVTVMPVVFMVLVTGSGFGVMAVVSSRVPLVPFRPVVRCGLCYRRKQSQHGYKYEFLHNLNAFFMFILLNC